MANDISINPHIKFEKRLVGIEQTAVIVADDLLTNCQTLIDIACQNTRFSAGERTAYPGVRSPLPDEFITSLLEKLLPEMRAVYALPKTMEPRQYYGLFSLVSTPEQDLKILQRVPHCDSRDPYYFAIMVYLNAGLHGGTGFYRHNPTGFERINNERFASYVQKAEDFMAHHGLPKENYYQANDGHFSLIGEVEYRPNRLVVYPGNLLHSGLINPQTDISADPGCGRLTANIFVAIA